MNKSTIFKVIGVDMWGGDYATRKVNNFIEAENAAKEWVTDESKCATLYEDTIYFKMIRNTNASKSGVHAKCTSFFYGQCY